MEKNDRFEIAWRPRLVGRGWGTRGSDFAHFVNYTTGPTEHSLTVLPDGRAMLVFRNDGDGSCTNPVGAYHNFYQTFSTECEPHPSDLCVLSWLVHDIVLTYADTEKLDFAT